MRGDVQTATEKNLPVLILRIFAWVNLFSGLIGSFLIWKHLVYTKITESVGTYYPRLVTKEILNPEFMILSIFFFLQGVFLWAVFLVFSSVAENILIIRNNTESLPLIKSSLSDFSMYLKKDNQ